MREEWKAVVGFEGKYEVSNMGRVKSWRGKSLIRKPQVFLGYHRVSLRKGKYRKTYMVHRLVAETFLPNPENKDTVNHKNGVRCDNNLKNLEWATMRENVIHAHTTGLVGSKIGLTRKTKKAKSKYPGVKRQPNGRWGVLFQYNFKKYWGGIFNTEEEAHMKYLKMHKDLQGVGYRTKL